MIKLNILFPVYNEHIRLAGGIEKTIAYMDTIAKDEYILTIVDNASADDTPDIARSLCQKYPQVKYIRLEEKGVGLAFRAGVKHNTAPIVGYMDVDLSTDIRALEKTLRIFETDKNVAMVNGSRWNKDSVVTGRKWYRSITSFGLVMCLKLWLGMKASDGICGFKFYRFDAVRRLIQEAGSMENGWFYIIELLIRAERKNLKIYELPVHWADDYNTTVNVKAQTLSYIKSIFALRKRFAQEEANKAE